MSYSSTTRVHCNVKNFIFCGRMSGRNHLSTAKISQVIDETIWKEKIAHEKKAKEYWENIYRYDTKEDKVNILKQCTNLRKLKLIGTL